MESLANVVVATADLVEAEGRTLRRQIALLALATAMLAGAGMLIAVGLGFVFYGFHQLLAAILPVPVAAALLGLSIIGIAGGLIWTVKKFLW